MQSVPELILPVAQVVRKYGESLLKDITAEKFARKPVVGGTTIDLNHPAFNYGHLALYPKRLLALLGVETAAVQVPPTWDELFKNGAPCHDDPEGTIYPRMEEITRKFFHGYDTAFELLPKVQDAVFFAPSTEERIRSRFPTNGSFVVHLLTSHVNQHLGQISGWRRCMGLGPA